MMVSPLRLAPLNKTSGWTCSVEKHAYADAVQVQAGRAQLVRKRRLLLQLVGDFLVLY